MIVDDQHEFIFIHIPKCGGTSLRNVLAPYDSTNGFFTGRVNELGQFGMVDHVHIPLSVLKVSFPEIFQKLKTYKSFALMRDPVDRFGSALGQWLKNVKHQRILELEPDAIVTSANSVIEKILEEPHTTVPSLVHFRRQEDFIMLDGVQMVKRLYRVEHLDQLSSAIQTYIDIDIGEIGHANRAVLYRSNLIRVTLGKVRPILSPIWKTAPPWMKSWLFHMLLQPPSEKIAKIRGTDISVSELMQRAGLATKIRDLYSTDYPLLDLCESPEHGEIMDMRGPRAERPV